MRLLYGAGWCWCLVCSVLLNNLYVCKHHQHLRLETDQIQIKYLEVRRFPQQFDSDLRTNVTTRPSPGPSPSTVNTQTFAFSPPNSNISLNLRIFLSDKFYIFVLLACYYCDVSPCCCWWWPPTPHPSPAISVRLCIEWSTSPVPYTIQGRVEVCLK